MHADPQSASMVKVIGADQNLIAALGFWLAVRAWRTQPSAGGNRATGQIDRPGSNRSSRGRRTSGHRREAWGDCRAVFPQGRPAQAQWARPVHGGVDGLPSMVRATWLQRGLSMFGRLARWRKDRVGGTVWYLDAELAEGYVGLAPVRGQKALPVLSELPKGTSTAH